MNILEGKIADIVTKDHLSLVKVKVDDLFLSAIVIDTPDSSDYLTMGNQVKVVFKETEVIIGKGTSNEISLQNRFMGKVEHIECGDLLARVNIATSVGPVISIITSNAVNQLGLEKGTPVTAMVKTNEMMLSS